MATLVGVGLVAAPAGAAGHGDPGMFGRHRFVHGGPAPVPGTIQVVATGLDQPKKLTLDPAGDVIVALSGDGAAPASCTDGAEPSCLDESGAIDRVTPQGRVTPLLGGLPSVSSGGPGPEATGPVEAREVAGTLQVLFQDTDVDPTTGAETYGPAGSDLGELRSFGWHDSGGVEANFGLFEGVANPDHGAGTAVTLGAEAAIDSDPYSFVPYRGGYAVADAAANDLLFVSPSGHISVLAVFPTISEVAPPGTLGPTQTTPVPVEAQPVPDAVAVGPDGALYVGELGGEPFDPGTSSVYRVVPGQSPTVVATGFTAIGDLAFDPSGHLYVLEIDTAGIADPALSGGGLPTHGALIQVGPHGTQSIVASTGLEFPTGLVIASEGTAYVSNYGVLSATGGPGGLSGELVRVGLPR
jgi:glucose/arabinose dehydrogenase